MDQEELVKLLNGKPLRVERDPNGADPHSSGSKLDAGKAPILKGRFQYFPRALKAVSMVSDFGSRKYTWGGWKTVPEGENRYGDAMARHILAEAMGEDFDPDSGMLHAAHTAWNALARLELLIKQAESHQIGFIR